MWAIGVILYQMLTGRHPFYNHGDDEVIYINRISKEPIDKILQTNMNKFDISPLAQSLLKRLLCRGISDRYRVYQALSHPWITRNLEDPTPLT